MRASGVAGGESRGRDRRLPLTLAATAAWARRLPIASATSRGRARRRFSDGAIGQFEGDHGRDSAVVRRPLQRVGGKRHRKRVESSSCSTLFIVLACSAE